MVRRGAAMKTRVLTYSHVLDQCPRQRIGAISQWVFQDQHGHCTQGCRGLRPAALLANLAGRLHARGFSRTELNLPMTREAIGSYLGMKIETVSRIFTRLVEQGMVKVNRRHVHILDPVALIRRVGQFEAGPAMALLSWS